MISGEEVQFDAWVQDLAPENQPRVFLNTGEQDPLMLERARAMAVALEQAGLDSTLLVGAGGHDYAYWVSNFPAYLSWLGKDWR